MVFKPILFSTPMVEAILKGRKTQTRRVIKKKYSNTDIKFRENKYGRQLVEMQNDVPDPVKNSNGTTTHHIRLYAELKPKYRVGDILWLRESWQYNDDLNNPYIYKQKFLEDYIPEYTKRINWKPSIHMPFDAARIFLKVKNIKVEKLQDISEMDAIAEGIDNHIDDEGKHQFYIYPVKEERYSRTTLGLALLCNSFISKGIFGLEEPAKFSFHSLWESINGMESWDLNPWVWVYEFEVLKTETGKCISCGCTDNNCKQCIVKTGNPCHWVNENHTVCSACKPQKLKP